MVYSYDGILHSHEKEWTTDAFNNMNNSHRYADLKENRCKGLMSIWFRLCKVHEQAKPMGGARS